MFENDPSIKDPESEKGLIYAPWERAFTRILTPFEEFIQRQTTSGLLLMGTAIVALLLVNSGFANTYHALVHTPISLHVGRWGIDMSLNRWVNEGLMSLFFFVVGMELKREMLVGELADLRQAILPFIAAFGGMVMPALIFLAVNRESEAAIGWGIPMATDTAFAVSALVLLSHRVPKALITFLVAMAIADDLGAVGVIALFYARHVALDWMVVSIALVLLLFVLNYAGIRRIWPYLGVAILLWFAILESGIHAALAGILGAFAVPARPKYNPDLFSARVKTMIKRFDSNNRPGGNILTNDKLYAVVQSLEKGVRGVQTPLQRLENIWHLPVAFLVIPVFSLFNAGIPLKVGSLGKTLTHPVFLGVFLGLALGKFTGITGACWLALRVGIGQLPKNTRFSQIAAVSVLGGIGFTMSIFIADLGFSAQPESLLIAKTGVLAASLLAGSIGFIWLGWLGRER